VPEVYMSAHVSVGVTSTSGAVPEPGSFVLAALGAVAMWSRQRRRGR